MRPMTPDEVALNARADHRCPSVDYVYAATVVRWVDGDTLDAVVDVGFAATRIERLRLYGVNTPGRAEPGWSAASAAAATLAPVGTAITIRTHHARAETFGRYVAEVWLPDGRDLPAILVATGHATAVVA